MPVDATALLNEVLRLPENERLELASRLFAQESSVLSAQPNVMSGAPVFKGTRVLAQTLFEYLEAGDSIDDFLEGYPSVRRQQVIGFLEETKARVVVYAAGKQPADEWPPEFLELLGSWADQIERPPSQKVTEMKDPFDRAANSPHGDRRSRSKLPE
jgi:uncharacterized protein (DUF433 family)